VFKFVYRKLHVIDLYSNVKTAVNERTLAINTRLFSLRIFRVPSVSRFPSLADGKFEQSGEDTDPANSRQSTQTVTHFYLLIDKEYETLGETSANSASPHAYTRENNQKKKL